MVSFRELQARVKEFLRFSKQEIIGLGAAILVTAFIFSFRDWGDEQFEFVTGVTHLLTLISVAAVSFGFRLSCQKIYALSQGYLAEFKPWWTGLIIAVIVTFITIGRIPLIFIGGVVAALMVKQRLGEFRYGFSFFENAVISLWGILGNILAAIIFAIGLHFLPQSYFFSKGLVMNIVMAFCALFPLPQLDGAQIYFGSRGGYYLAIGVVFLTALLLLTKTTFGLITMIIIAALAGIIYLLIGSEK